jgi:hypothetical protein
VLGKALSRASLSKSARSVSECAEGSVSTGSPPVSETCYAFACRAKFEGQFHVHGHRRSDVQVLTGSLKIRCGSGGVIVIEGFVIEFEVSVSVSLRSAVVLREGVRD